MARAIVIPADKTKPLRWADHPKDDWKNMTALVFNGNREGGTYTMSTVGDRAERRVSLFYDDEGLFRIEAGEHLPDIINLRAMELWAFCEGGMNLTDFRVPLVGDYVVVGDADSDGNSMDAPEWVAMFPFEWHQKYLLVEKEGRE